MFPFPVVDRALDWYKAFAQDHDAEFLLQGVTHGFSYQFTDSDPDGVYYCVRKYVPNGHAHKMEAWVRSYTTTGRYITVDREFARATAAMVVRTILTS